MKARTATVTPLPTWALAVGLVIISLLVILPR
jgi:hypothetical protein